MEPINRLAHVTVVVTCSLEYDECGLGLLSNSVLSHKALSEGVLKGFSVVTCNEQTIMQAVDLPVVSYW